MLAGTMDIMGEMKRKEPRDNGFLKAFNAGGGDDVLAAEDGADYYSRLVVL